MNSCPSNSKVPTSSFTYSSVPPSSCVKKEPTMKTDRTEPPIQGVSYSGKSVFSRSGGDPSSSSFCMESLFPCPSRNVQFHYCTQSYYPQRLSLLRILVVARTRKYRSPQKNRYLSSKPHIKKPHTFCLSEIYPFLDE